GLPTVSPVERITMDTRPKSSPTCLFTRGRCWISSSTRMETRIAVSCVFGNGDARWFDTFGQGARPVDIEGSIHLSKAELLAVPFEGRRHIGRRLISSFRVELGIRSMAFKEMTESSIKVAQGLLKRNTGDFIQPGGLCLFFEE